MKILGTILSFVIDLWLGLVWCPPRTIRENQPMRWNIDKLPFNGSVRDYSDINPGDSVEISTKSVLLKAALKNMWNNEKQAMQSQSDSIGCKLKEEQNKNYVTIHFLKV